jgi:hypothetical protein
MRAQALSDSISVNHLAFIQSLPPKEFATGREIHAIANNSTDEHRQLIRTSFNDVVGVDDFRRVMMRLIELAQRAGLRPVLHVDAHGEEDFGLHFADGSQMSWQEWCSMLRDLNRATRFNLLVVVSACYGVNLVQGVRLSHAAPCVAWIGPHDETDPGEILGRFRAFYTVLIETMNMRDAMGVMRGHSSHGAQFDIFTCEWWFENLMSQFLAENLSPTGLKQSVMRQYGALKARGLVPNLTVLKREHKRNLPEVVMKYFDEYFMLDSLRENEERFRALREHFVTTLSARLKTKL